MNPTNALTNSVLDFFTIKKTPNSFKNSVLWVGEHAVKRVCVLPVTVLACAVEALNNLTSALCNIVGSPMGAKINAADDCSKGRLGTHLILLLKDLLIAPIAVTGLIFHPSVPSVISRELSIKG